MALVTDKWIGTSSADWGASAANWSAGLPTSADNVVIGTKTVLTVTFSGADTYTIHSLVVGDDVFDMSGGSLTITTAASLADGFAQTGGTLTAGGTVTVDGTGTLTGGVSEGGTAFIFDGTVALGNYLLGGGTSLSNKKTTDLTAQITLGDNTGVNARIDNEKGGTFAIAGDFGIDQGAATASFINAGTFSKIGGTGTSQIFVDFTDTGRITVDAGGTIEFGGPANSFAGSISGAGQVYLGAGSKDVIASGTKISSATFTISDGGTVVTLDENLALGKTFNLQNNAVLDLGRNGLTLTLSGTDNLVGSAALATTA
jgi:fibronectin-binding autotransporter adhesin